MAIFAVLLAWPSSRALMETTGTTLPLAALATQFVQFVLTFAVVVPVTAAFQGGLSATVVAVVPAMLLQLAFTAGLGLLLAVAYVHFRDTRHLVDVGTQLWFWLTPIVYARAMIPARRGRIVMVTAMVARGLPGMSHTGAARAGVENLTQTLAIEWAMHNLRVNCVAPGNNIASSGTAQYGETAMERARQATPVRRLGTVQDVARVIIFLASHQNDFVTGSIYRVDGGQALWGDLWQIPDPIPPTTRE